MIRKAVFCATGTVFLGLLWAGPSQAAPTDVAAIAPKNYCAALDKIKNSGPQTLCQNNQITDDFCRNIILLNGPQKCELYRIYLNHVAAAATAIMNDNALTKPQKLAQLAPQATAFNTVCQFFNGQIGLPEADVQHPQIEKHLRALMQTARWQTLRASPLAPFVSAAPIFNQTLNNQLAAHWLELYQAQRIVYFTALCQNLTANLCAPNIKIDIVFSHKPLGIDGQAIAVTDKLADFHYQITVAEKFFQTAQYFEIGPLAAHETGHVWQFYLTDLQANGQLPPNYKLTVEFLNLRPLQLAIVKQMHDFAALPKDAIQSADNAAIEAAYWQIYMYTNTWETASSIGSYRLQNWLTP